MSVWDKPDEWAELNEVHDQVIRQRDRLSAEEADLKEKMAELEAFKAAARLMSDNLQKEMESRNKELEEIEEIRHLATHDSLTGLWNRAAILEILKRELDRAERDGTMGGVLISDLDHFKSVNDTFGHLAGDAVLQESCRRISAALTPGDSVGRYGDDYFLIVLSGCEDETDIMKQAERIRAANCTEPVHTTEGNIPITVSIGLASSSTFQKEEALIRAADAALYRAKRAGGNRIEVAVTA